MKEINDKKILRTLIVNEVDGKDARHFKTVLHIVEPDEDIFVNEDGKEIGKVQNKGIREQKKEKPEKPDRRTTDLEVNMNIDYPANKVGDEVTFTVFAKNLGKENAEGVTVENALSNGYELVKATPSVGTFENEIWTIGNLNVGKEENIKIVAKRLEQGISFFQAKIYSDEYDRNPTNDMIKTGDRVFVIKTIEKKFDSGAPSAGITKKEAKETEEFIINNLNNKDAFTLDCIAYRNTIEIPSKESTRQEMVKIVEQDDGNGGSEGKNNREYGGKIDKDGNVTEAEKGKISDLSKQNHAEIEISSKVGESIFHSHPSGGSEEKKESAFSGTSIQFGSKETSQFSHAPSNEFLDEAGNKKGDIYGAKVLDNNDMTIRYVFARRAPQKVYMYNCNGVLATLPHKYFVTFKK